MIHFFKFTSATIKLLKKLYKFNFTAWKVSKYGVFVVHIFLYPYSIQIQENTDHKKLRICTLFTQRFIHKKENTLHVQKLYS